MYRLYLDDIRTPIMDTDFIVVRSFSEAVAYVMEHGFPLFVSFDHDLGDADSRTGYDFAKWLVEYDMDHDVMPLEFDYNVHSANPVGRENIERYLENYLRSK